MDTETTSLESWRYEWRAWGLTLDERTFFADHGGDITEERYQLLGNAVGSTYDRELSHRRRPAFRDTLHTDLGLSPGMPEWLDEATTQGWRLAVASSSPREWVQTHLDRAGVTQRFEVIACGDDVAQHKPHPAVYLLALAQLNITADNAVAIEDTEHGVRAARAAGLACIAVPHQRARDKHFADANWIVHEPASTALMSLLESGA
jgi:putative hydrolase of the HAD superfamily